MPDVTKTDLLRLSKRLDDNRNSIASIEASIVSGAVAGPQGEAGVGVPEGGSTGQVLKKASGDDFDTEWGNVEFGNLDGGTPTSVYGGTVAIDGGSV